MVSLGKVYEIIVLSTVIERDFFEKLVYFVFYLYKGNKFCLCWNYIPSQAWKFFRRKTKFWHLVILIFYNTALVHRITYDIIWYFFIVTISTLFTEFQATKKLNIVSIMFVKKIYWFLPYIAVSNFQTILWCHVI